MLANHVFYYVPNLDEVLAGILSTTKDVKASPFWYEEKEEPSAGGWTVFLLSSDSSLIIGIIHCTMNTITMMHLANLYDFMTSTRR